MEEIREGILINNRYLLKKLKGSGSFGEVWLAEDKLLKIDVAIKIYIPLDDNGLNEFRTEYLTTQGISHPNLLTPSHIDTWGRKPFLIMDYCPDGSVASKAGKINEKEIWKFIFDVASGLSYLHNLPTPIIHQDIKPDNILISQQGNYLITDFGISKKIRITLQKQTQKKTEDLKNSGALAYMGPEKFIGRSEPIKASDIWALGVSIYELVTGELPFIGMGGQMLLQTNILPSLDKSWSTDLNKVMRDCLSKDTWNRPTADKLRDLAQKKIEGNRLSIIDNKTEKLCIENDSSSKNENQKELQKPLYKPNNTKWLFLIMIAVIVTGGIFVFLRNSDDSKSSISITQPQVNNENTETLIPKDVKEKPIQPENISEDVKKKSAQTENVNSNVSVGKKIDNKPKHTSESKPVAQTIQQATIGEYNYGYASYSGELKNGKPHGKGRLTFTSSHSDNKYGYSADAGDYIEGYFTNGSLDAGATLYKNNGSRKKLY